jgi:hypothetical protein
MKKLSNARIVAGSILAALFFFGFVNKPKAEQSTTKTDQQVITENIKLDQLRDVTSCLVYVTHGDNSDKAAYTQKAHTMLLNFPSSYRNVSSYFFGLAKGYMHGMAVGTKERYSQLTEAQALTATADALFNRAECTVVLNEHS